MPHDIGTPTGPGSDVPGVHELDETTLVIRAGEGDADAFEQLVDRHQTGIYRLAVRMLSDRAEAEDVVQEVFLAAWRRLPDLRAPEAFSGWLYRMATNRCLNVLRGRRVPVEADLDQMRSTAPHTQPERAAESAAAVDALTRALERLTPEQRAAWLLREVHGRSYAEIADILGASVPAVRGRIARSRAELAEVMQPWR